MNEIITAIALVGGVFYPLYAAIFARQTREKLMAEQHLLNKTYRTIIATQWALAIPLMVLVPFSDYKYSTLGMGFIYKPLWIAGLIVGSLLSYALLQGMKIPEKRLPSLKKQMEASMYILPKNLSEYRWSIALSVTAGFCEELLFRGILFLEINRYLPLIPSILLANVCFAMGHIGTGLKNMSMTFILGLIWSATFYFTGSLWAPILLHIIVDFYSMTTAYKIFKTPHRVLQPTGPDKDES